MPSHRLTHSRWLLAVVIVVGFDAFGQRVSVSAHEQVGCWQSAPATTTCRIDEPNVKQPRSEYPQIRFTEGSVVRVIAGGCVQTGGAGETWKRYVDPRGSNADRLYHGLIWFPGLPIDLESVDANGRVPLLRLSEVVGRSITVHRTCPAQADCQQARPGSVQGYLTLGYEDDNYNDNGYWRHDDGGGQCRGIGSAFVELVIQQPGPAVVQPSVSARPPTFGVPPAPSPRDYTPIACGNYDGPSGMMAMLCREFRDEVLSSDLSVQLPDAGDRPTGSQVVWRTDRGTIVTARIVSDLYTRSLAKLGETQCRQLLFSRSFDGRTMNLGGSVCRGPAGSWTVWGVQ